MSLIRRHNCLYTLKIAKYIIQGFFIYKALSLDVCSFDTKVMQSHKKHTHVCRVITGATCF